MTQATTAGPVLDEFRGRIADLDSHLMWHPDRIAEILGETLGAQMRERFKNPQVRAAFAERTYRFADVEPTPENVFTLKGFPRGTSDAAQRLHVLDCMGVERQLIFPSGLWAATFVQSDEAFAAVRRYNDIVLEWAKDGNGRLRPAAILNMTTVEEALREAERIIPLGAVAVQLACNRPPAGISPADPQWDPLWRMLEQANIPGLFHIAGNVGFVDGRFGALRHLQPQRSAESDEPVGPFFMQIMHMAPETYLAGMIMGGVFERFPTLRWGVIELGGRWVGPWCDMMDANVEMFAHRFSPLLSLKPSQYVQRNIRITPFYGEPVGQFIERWPQYALENVYVFSTDFPHVEGGDRPLETFGDSLAPLGRDVMQKFFVENGRFLLP